MQTTLNTKTAPLFTVNYGGTDYPINPLCFNYGHDGRIDLLSYKDARSIKDKKGKELVTSAEWNKCDKLIKHGMSKAFEADKMTLSFVPVSLRGKAGTYSEKTVQASAKWKEENPFLVAVALKLRRKSDADLRVTPIEKLAAVDSSLDHKFIKKLMTDYGLKPIDKLPNGLKESSMACLLRTFKNDLSVTLETALIEFSKRADQVKPLPTVATSKPSKRKVKPFTASKRKAKQDKLALAMANGKGE